MLVYIDANCFNRPFDEQQQERIHRETEAVLAVLERVDSGADELAWSPALTLELSAHPEVAIREQLTAWSARAGVDVTTTASVHDRIKELVAGGLKPLDAAHVAFAETAKCEVLLTCDDRFLRRAQQLDLSVRVLNPIEYLTETEDGGIDD
jgi:predicted nucleic acid-binding protein